ncbi:hypothetical protein KVH27_34960 [Streptomyces olivaceus]|uniref:hypothetical protein n=1 Tax=Streptomyces olivaceus TaxID=47716 RepID=UPI001CCD364D|nr:hypothetical protein [Streptomyces olivaceus]MBZ6253552.1 hypothetical protein [Streptomyces olivaceus]
MSDPAPKPCDACPAALEPAELISDGTCRTRLLYHRVLLVLVALNLIGTCVFGVLGIVGNDSSTKPKPAPSSSPTPGDPEPSSPATGANGGTWGPPSSGDPTPSNPDGCNFFNPECGATAGATG